MMGNSDLHIDATDISIVHCFGVKNIANIAKCVPVECYVENSPSTFA